MHKAPSQASPLRWLIAWIGGMVAVGVWDAIFLNRPAFRMVSAGFVNTVAVAVMVVILTLVLGWMVTLTLHFFESRRLRAGALAVTFLLNLVRSVPQIVGILFGYVAIASLVDSGTIRSPVAIFALMACTMSLFVFVEVIDLMRERIDYFRKLDFFHAMQVCGIRESRIINFNILWKNSRMHILNKLIGIFGSAVFLQCSVDFIISVGLSTDVNPVNLPPTLGSLLANIDSKQDILAVGNSLTHLSYIPKLFTVHLQGMTVAFLIVFTLVSIYRISNAYAERHRL